MKITQNIQINEDKITATITVAELGDSTRDAQTELNQIHNWCREIEFSKIMWAMGINCMFTTMD